MAHHETGGQQHGRQVLPVDGKEDEHQTRRNGQQENHPRSDDAGIVQQPADVIDCYTGNSRNDPRRKQGLAPLFVDDETEARHGQHLENGADDVHHRRDGRRAKNVIRRGDGKPDEVRRHYQQE